MLPLRVAVSAAVTAAVGIGPLSTAEAEDTPAWAQVGSWGQAFSAAVPTPNAAPSAAAPPTPVMSLEGGPAPQGGVPSGQRPTQARQDDSDRPIHFSADEVEQDRDLDIVTARGSVVATQGRRRLTADTVSYNSKQDLVTASGNVTLVEPTGEVLHTEYMELTGDFAEGVARKIKVVATDRSRISAESGTRRENNISEFEDATYTACVPCREHPERPPLWQVDAKRVVHNQDEQVIEYYDAWLNFDGNPVAYTPYISAPDPTVRRRSGFLTPTVSGSTSIGESLTTPYYYVLSDRDDVTVYPRFLLSNFVNAGSHGGTGDGAVLDRMLIGAQQRWAGNSGVAENYGAITENPSTGAVRGIVNAKGITDVSSNWRMGYVLQRESDITFSQVYDYTIPGDKPWLTSRAYAEGFWNNDYSVIEGYSLQGITTTTSATTQSPWVLPHAMYNHVSTPGPWGDTWTWNADTLNYMRQAGVSANRVSSILTWSVPYRSDNGQDWTLSTSLNTAAYRADGLPQVGSAVDGRAVPMMAITWKYPFTNSSVTFPQTITPLGMVAASPLWGNPHDIPNEDSLDYELDDTSILRPNRLAGLDRIETGLRGAYGIRWSGYPGPLGIVTAQVAQGWRAHDDSEFTELTSFTGNFSDYIARLTYSAGPFFSLSDRVRLDRENLSARRNEASITAGPQTLNGSISYFYFDKTLPNAPTVLGLRQQVYVGMKSEITRYWSVEGLYQTDLTTGSSGKPIGWFGTLTYNDDCFAFVGRFQRNFTYSNDYLAGVTFSINIVLKTFGQFPYTVFSE